MKWQHHRVVLGIYTRIDIDVLSCLGLHVGEVFDGTVETSKCNLKLEGYSREDHQVRTLPLEPKKSVDLLNSLETKKHDSLEAMSK